MVSATLFQQSESDRNSRGGWLLKLGIRAGVRQCRRPAAAVAALVLIHNSSPPTPGSREREKARLRERKADSPALRPLLPSFFLSLSFSSLSLSLPSVQPKHWRRRRDAFRRLSQVQGYERETKNLLLFLYFFFFYSALLSSLTSFLISFSSRPHFPRGILETRDSPSCSRTVYRMCQNR